MASKNVTLPITGMSCANCALNIERNLKKLQGVEDTSVNFASEQASVSFDPEQIEVDDLIKKIEDIGYGIATARVELPITGMTCANCAMTIERTLNKKVPGVVQASVNFASEKAAVQYLPNLTSVEEMIAAIRQAGYDAIPPDETGEDEDVEQRARRAEIADQTRKFAVGPLEHGKGLRPFGSVEPGFLGQLGFLGPGNARPVLYWLGLLYRRLEKPEEPQRQHGRVGGYGFFGCLFLFPCGSPLSCPG
jgi:copper ion binding protein